MHPNRDGLIQQAKAYAERLESRPGVVGVVLYGSLACSPPEDLTPFSDIDLLPIVEETPPEFHLRRQEGDWLQFHIEHRVWDGVKIDLSFLTRDDVLDLGRYRLLSPHERGWIPHYLVKSFLLGEETNILHDPTGEFHDIRRRLRETTDYPSLLRSETSRWFHALLMECLRPSEKALEHGNFVEAFRYARDGARGFARLVQEAVERKDRRAAAEKLGLPAFEEKAGELDGLNPPPPVGPTWEAAHELWNYTFRTIWEPLREELCARGEDPEKLELIGSYEGLFWPGHRLHELGRVIRDVNLTFDWSRYEQERGREWEAARTLWPLREARDTTRRWEALEEALRDAGHEASHLVRPALESDEYRQLAEALDDANRRSKEETERDTPPEKAERAVHLLREMRDLVADALDLTLVGRPEQT